MIPGDGVRYIVGVTRWGAAPAYRDRPTVGQADDADIQLIARHLGQVPYEVRLKVATSPPVALGPFRDLAQVQELVAELRDRGHGAVACDAEKVVSSETAKVARSFEFGADSLVVALRDGTEGALPYDELMVLVRAVCHRSEEITEETQTKRFSMMRTAMTGGLVRRAQRTSKTQSTTIETEQILYAYRQRGDGTVLFREQSLNFLGLGDRIGLTAVESFDRFVRALAERASAARLDERLVSEKRRGSTLTAASFGGHSRVATSNQGETDLAAHLVAIGHLQNQL